MDERMRRLFAAAEALASGRGGITAVSLATGVSRRAITAGIRELRQEGAAQPLAGKARLPKPEAPASKAAPGNRLFAHITMNWRGKPLTSHEVIVNLIRATTTAKGLEVRSELDEGTYPTGRKVSDEELQTINLTRHSFHGEWNYTISPSRRDPAEL